MAEARDWATHIETVARTLLGKPNRSMSNGTTWRFGSKGALAVHVQGEFKGTWHDFESDAGGGVLALVAKLRGCSLGEAASWLEAELGLERKGNGAAGPHRTNAGPTPPPVVIPRLVDKWHERFEACGTIGPGDPAGKYLLARGCVLPPPYGDLRWHPHWPHPTGHAGPALVGAVTLVSDASHQLTLHQTWIKGDGSAAKAFSGPGTAVNKMFLKGHPKTGGVLRLWPDDAVTSRLGVAEGIETALTLARRVTPVWACLDAANLGDLPPLAGISDLVVAIDRDPAGAAAWAKLRAGWRGRRLVHIATGLRRHDFNDWRGTHAEE